MTILERFRTILQEGEGAHVEFKESVTKQLDKEIVALANATGGTIFIGINDRNEISGTTISNGVKSQIQDIAYNCDPSIPIKIIAHQEIAVMEVIVEEGMDKPYRCRDGFYMRQGENTQKLKRDEIINFMADSGKTRFDESINKTFRYPEDFSEEAFSRFLDMANIQHKATAKDMLISLHLAHEEKGQFFFTNAGVLFFAKTPQKFFPESYITAVQYQSLDRFSILDKKEITGNLIEIIDDAIGFLTKHINMAIQIGDKPSAELGRRIELYDYPLPAIREVVINAVVHRDYLFDSSHIYIHLFPDRMEVENPGGLYRGMTMDMLSLRSVRRNRLIAEVLHRTGYIEKVGSGFARIENTLAQNNNPPYEITATNFFSIRFYKRVQAGNVLALTPRQRKLFGAIQEVGWITSTSAANFLSVSNDTALNELNVLLQRRLVVKEGQGRATVYKLY